MTERDRQEDERGEGATPAELPAGGYQRPAAEGRQIHDAGDLPGAGFTGERGLPDGAADEVAEAFDEEGILERIDRRQAGAGNTDADARTQAAIRDRLAAEPVLDADAIEVRVRRGEVRLSGSVETRSERSRAGSLAEAVDGVSYVQNDIRARNPFYHDADRQLAAAAKPSRQS